MALISSQLPKSSSCTHFLVVTTLAKVWMKTGLGRCPDKRMFELPQGPQMAKFKAKYDQTQKQLKVIAAMDDLLSGKSSAVIFS